MKKDRRSHLQIRRSYRQSLDVYTPCGHITVRVESDHRDVVLGVFADREHLILKSELPIYEENKPKTETRK